MKLPPLPTSTAPKARQANVRLSEAQATALKIHCNRTGMTMQDVLMIGLVAVVPGFPAT